ncbi:MAG: 3-deoxy-8-phosphooctulonate synthase [Rhodospirillales bacterium]|nr:3-deoxy-8-phosphooctulonate synthase [Rhodospirillales bacterium]
MTSPKTVQIGNLAVSNAAPLTIIAGPCVMESRDHAFRMAGALADLAKELDVGLIYKTSYDKANRTSVDSPRGLGLDDALTIFSDLKSEFGCAVLTDVHSPEDAKTAASVVDVLQIPAFLCRQTDLLIAAGETGRALNIKKGQFLAPWDMANVVAKVETTGNTNIMVCERGASFGYNTLVTDMRALPILAQTGYPVIFDATHSVQQPGGQGTSSGGQREFAPILARAAVSIGVAGVFMETHNDPDQAPSDGPNMIKFNKLRNIIEILLEFDALAKQRPFTL